MKVYYFGCGPHEIGHFFWGEGLGRHGSTFDPVGPWGHVDGRLAPQEDRKLETQGVVRVHRKDGWTALAWWDRSVDHRGASNSVLLFDGETTFEDGIQLGREQFPWVFKRITFELREG